MNSHSTERHSIWNLTRTLNQGQWKWPICIQFFAWVFLNSVYTNSLRTLDERKKKKLHVERMSINFIIIDSNRDSSRWKSAYVSRWMVRAHFEYLLAARFLLFFFTKFKVLSLIICWLTVTTVFSSEILLRHIVTNRVTIAILLLPG